MYKNNQLWNRYFLRSQRISYWYKETPQCPSIYIIDLNKFLLLFLLTITKQKYFSSSPKLLLNYIVFEFTLLLVVRPRYSENYIATISCTWEWASRKDLTESSTTLDKAATTWKPWTDRDFLGHGTLNTWRSTTNRCTKWMYPLLKLIKELFSQCLCASRSNQLSNKKFFC